MVRNYIRKTERGLSYTREQLREAVEKVRSGEYNGSEAAVRYNIPRTTLHDHVIGKGKNSHTLGKPPVLSAEVEQILVENLQSLQDNGFNLGRKEVLHLVGLYLNANNIKNPFKSGKPGDAWLMAFCKRQDFNYPKPLYKEFGAKEKDVIIVKDFYSILEMRLTELDLADKPGQIWHIEEHCFFNGKRVAGDEKQKDVTFVTACNAEGKKAPLLTVFKGDESHDWMLGKHVNVSHTRGMCVDVFKDYFQTVFLNYIDDTRPNLVILEAQSFPIDIDLVAEARKAKVTLLNCPSYLEGLDMAIAKSFKLRVSESYEGSSKEFSSFVADVFDGVKVSEIEEDLKNAGVHPFAPVPDSKFDDYRLRVYEEYKVIKERQMNSFEVNDPEEVMVKEDIELQDNFVMELEMDESSTSMSMTEEVELQSACNSQLLRHALIAVKKGLTVMEATGSLNDEIHQKRQEYSATETDTNTEENKLLNWIMNLNNAGFATTEEMLAEAVRSQGAPFKRASVRHSYEDFLKEHPDVKDKLSQNVSSYQVTAESVRVWLVCVKRYLKKINAEDVFNCPKRIFNFGEAGFSLKPEKLPLQENKTENEDVTVLVTASADGNLQAPSVIFPFKLPGLDSSVWTKSDILKDHITDFFYPWLIENNISLPVVLFMDRTTQIDLSLSELFKEKQIIPIALLSPEIQPLQALFQPLKIYWTHNNSAIQKLKKDELAKELESYVNRDFKKEIMDSFKACGIYSFDPNIKYIDEIDRRAEKRRRMEDLEKNEANETNSNLLKEVEKRITKEVLEEFMKSGDSWKGDPAHSSLFVFWKGIREEYSKKDTQESENCIQLDGDVYEIFIDEAETELRNF